MKHENNYFTRIFLIFFVGKKKGHIFAPSKMTLSMIVPLCNGSTAGLVLSVQVRILVGQHLIAQVVKLVYTLVSGTSGFTAV